MNMAPPGWRAGVDIGGTFTDLLLVDADGSHFRVEKVLTTSTNPAEGVRTALTAGLESARVAPAQLGKIKLISVGILETHERSGFGLVHRR